jgi:hypothetical protein
LLDLAQKTPARLFLAVFVAAQGRGRPAFGSLWHSGAEALIARAGGVSEFEFPASTPKQNLITIKGPPKIWQLILQA